MSIVFRINSMGDIVDFYPDMETAMQYQHNDFPFVEKEIELEPESYLNMNIDEI